MQVSGEWKLRRTLPHLCTKTVIALPTEDYLARRCFIIINFLFPFCLLLRRVMSGFSDAFYKEWTAFYSAEENQLDRAAATKIYTTRESSGKIMGTLRAKRERKADV